MWREYNPNPRGARVGDCTVRALSAALEQSWEDTYVGLALEGLILGDMPSANRTWGAYLEQRGFRRRMIEDECAKCYTVRDFARQHPHGVYVLVISGYAVCVRDADWWDSFDSAEEVPIFYFTREE